MQLRSSCSSNRVHGSEVASRVYRSEVTVKCPGPWGRGGQSHWVRGRVWGSVCLDENVATAARFGEIAAAGFRLKIGQLRWEGLEPPAIPAPGQAQRSGP